MRAFRAVAGVLVSAVVLAGCGASGSGGGDGAPPRSSAEPAAGTTTGPAAGPTTAPAAATSAGPDPSGSPTRAPAPGETLVRVTRSGGFAGDTHTLVVKGDGSWTRLDAKAKGEDTGRQSEQELTALRTALREADFARLPRTATGGPKIYDGFFYAFVHGGYEITREQGSLPPALERVVAALPPFTAR
ncbi:hypothetical protein [Streptomyces sp. NRRL F-2664]|uniref:hypothetical protein n=1 Tax=Streptomyces sp. NRRL F-2664 TaxID=1463842 RepID=UPI0004C8A6BE|nr:hypothetical protein [Streptomyces sp. NRRL F-2664]